jgi:hypothetical protein
MRIGFENIRYVFPFLNLAEFIEWNGKIITSLMKGALVEQGQNWQNLQSTGMRKAVVMTRINICDLTAERELKNNR